MKIQQAFDNDFISITYIHEWYTRFTDGRMSVESGARSGRPSTTRNDEVINPIRILVMQGRYIAI